MNHMNMNGLNANNVGGGGMPVMNNGTNGASSRTASDHEQRETDYKTRLNTYIYDYLLKNEQYDCARQLLKSSLTVNTTNKSSPRGRQNGVDENSMDTDSKDDLDSKRPHDLPLPENVDALDSSSFLLEWFSLFWDMFWAQKGNKGRSGQQAFQYMTHTQQQSRMRQEQQQQFLRQPGMMQAGSMQNYQNMIRMQQQAGGMQMSANELRHRASQNNLRNVNPQVMAAARNQQLMQQQQMERAGSDMDINGQRPRTPSSGDNAPSPSKRPRLDAPQFPNQPMIQNGRIPPQGMQGQQMMNYNNNMSEAGNMLMQNNINPNNLSPQQMESFQASNSQVRKKSIQVYNQNMAQQVRNSMPQAGMTTQGSPMMQAGMDAHAGVDFYGSNNRMGGSQGPNAGGNHALQDYQMQLMLLEQQNKKRLLMARQEQDQLRPDGQPGIPGQQPGFTQGMSPQGSRSGPSPNPSDQMKRGTPKMGQAGLPGSPMPDGSLTQIRGSPGPMNFNQMPAEMFMKGMGDGMPVGPNSNGMRPPSSHPQFANGQMNQQHMDTMRGQVPNGGRMPNGANWQQGPQGQAPMIPQASQNQSQMGTPQQRNAMPPPQGVPAGGAANGRPASPAQAPAPPTPQQANKANPKGKKEGEKPRKRPAKKGSVAAATPSADAENPPPTPTPSTPITPMHPKSFTDKNGNGQAQGTNSQTTANVPAPAAPVAQPQQEVNVINQFNNMEGIDSDQFQMTFGELGGPDVLESFDFDSFLQDQGGDHEFLDASIDASMAFANFDTVEAGTGNP